MQKITLMCSLYRLLLTAATILPFAHIVNAGLESPMHFAPTLEDKVSLYDNRLNLSSNYGFGIESGTLYHKSGGYHRWYINSNANNGASDNMELSSSRLYIRDKLGIGITSPSYTLDVNGSMRSQGFFTATGVIYIRPQNTSLEGGHLQLQKANSSQSDWNMDHYNGSLRIYMSGGSFSHYFHSNGNVGFGTSSPDYKLDVNGAIRAKEFFVETGWSDFVFEDDYKLPTLEEVEDHIEKHGHLPDVPSAAEIQEKGLEMGQAQTIMMQKIEELTLYVLQLSEENTALRDDSTQLRKELDELRREVSN